MTTIHDKVKEHYLVDKIYKYKHQMEWIKVMKQLKKKHHLIIYHKNNDDLYECSNCGKEFCDKCINNGLSDCAWCGIDLCYKCLDYHLRTSDC